jgi:hypothetical protein
MKLFLHFRVGQVGNLPPIENRPLAFQKSNRPIFNRRQDAILPYIEQS